MRTLVSAYNIRVALFTATATRLINYGANGVQRFTCKTIRRHFKYTNLSASTSFRTRKKFQLQENSASARHAVFNSLHFFGTGPYLRISLISHHSHVINSIFLNNYLVLPKKIVCTKKNRVKLQLDRDSALE